MHFIPWFAGVPTQHLLCLVWKMLLSAGANVDTRSNIGMIALMSATCNGHRQIVEVR